MNVKGRELGKSNSVVTVVAKVNVLAPNVDAEKSAKYAYAYIIDNVIAGARLDEIHLRPKASLISDPPIRYPSSHQVLINASMLIKD